MEDTVGGRQIVQWLELHDPTHQNLQRMGGASLVPAVRALFAVNLHHTGYLHAASTLATRLASLAASDSSGQAWERVLRESKPPSFLLSAWEHAMKLRVSARGYYQRLIQFFPDMEMSQIAQALVNRCRFLLFDLEAWKSDQLVDGPLNTDLSSWLLHMSSEKFATSFLPSMNELHTVCTTTLAFLLNPWTSVPHLRAAMRAGQARALCRREGLKAVRRKARESFINPHSLTHLLSHVFPHIFSHSLTHSLTCLSSHTSSHSPSVTYALLYRCVLLWTMSAMTLDGALNVLFSSISLQQFA
jgi:hypothetical protein